MELLKLVTNKEGGEGETVINGEVFSLRKGKKMDSVVEKVKDFIRTSRILRATEENRMDISLHDLRYQSGVEFGTWGDVKCAIYAISLVKTPTKTKLFTVLPDWSLRRVGDITATVGEIPVEEAPAAEVKDEVKGTESKEEAPAAEVKDEVKGTESKEEAPAAEVKKAEPKKGESKTSKKTAAKKSTTTKKDKK
jgi:hypothetical protein